MSREVITYETKIAGGYEETYKITKYYKTRHIRRGGYYGIAREELVKTVEELVSRKASRSPSPTGTIPVCPRGCLRRCQCRCASSVSPYSCQPVPPKPKEELALVGIGPLGAVFAKVPTTPVFYPPSYPTTSLFSVGGASSSSSSRHEVHTAEYWESVTHVPIPRKMGRGDRLDLDTYLSFPR